MVLLQLFGAKVHYFVLFLPFLASCYSSKTCISPPKIALYSPKTSVPELTLKINNGCNA